MGEAVRDDPREKEDTEDPSEQGDNVWNDAKQIAGKREKYGARSQRVKNKRPREMGASNDLSQ